MVTRKNNKINCLNGLWPLAIADLRNILRSTGASGIAPPRDLVRLSARHLHSVIFGWTNLKTAQIYVEKAANKRRMTVNAFEHRERSIEAGSVSLPRPQNIDETNEEKTMHNQCEEIGMVGDERLELPTSSV